MINKLIIGSANFGLKYGVANKKKLKRKDIFEILDYAEKIKVWGIDTAVSYGDAEDVIGSFLMQKREKSFRVITKIPHKDYESVKAIKDEVKKSRSKLNVECIDFLFLHSFETYNKYKKIAMPAFEELMREGVVGHWGVSIYHVEEANQILSDGFSDFGVEFPLNIFDKRFLKDDFLTKLKQRGCFLFARSIFLQGLFFLSAKDFKGNLRPAKENVIKLRRLAEDFDIPLSNIMLLFVATKPHIDGFIMGVDSREQFEKNMAFVNSLKKYQKLQSLLEKLEVHDAKILLPYLWR